MQNRSSVELSNTKGSGRSGFDVISGVHLGRTRWSLRIFVVSLVLLISWAAVSEIDQVTRAQAQIVAADRTQVIQAADGGVVTQIHVKEGVPVKAGQLLVTLQKERALAAVDDSNAKVAALRITLERLKAEVYGRPLHFSKELLEFGDYVRNQTDLYHKRQKAFKEDIASLEAICLLANEELRMNRALEATGDVSHAEILRLQRGAADINAQISNRRNKYFQDAQAEMTKAQEELSTQIEQLRDRSQILEHTELTAPVDGIVNNIRISTLGALAKPGETILELVPTQSNLVVEAKVTPADIASVATGQVAKVNLDAYDSSIYGALKGEVSYVSPDVLQEDSAQGKVMYYRVRIVIKEFEFIEGKGREIRLRPGLTGSVDIKARERTVLSYLLKPIIKTFDRSFGER